MTIFSGEGKGGGAYFEFQIQQGRLIDGGRLFEETDTVYSFGLLLNKPKLQKNIAADLPPERITNSGLIVA